MDLDGQSVFDYHPCFGVFWCQGVVWGIKTNRSLQAHTLFEHVFRDLWPPDSRLGQNFDGWRRPREETAEASPLCNRGHIWTGLKYCISARHFVIHHFLLPWVGKCRSAEVMDLGLGHFRSKFLAPRHAYRPPSPLYVHDYGHLEWNLSRVTVCCPLWFWFHGSTWFLLTGTCYHG